MNIKLEKLTSESFRQFGDSLRLIPPPDEIKPLVDEPWITFWPDPIRVWLGNSTICAVLPGRVKKRELEVDWVEYHSKSDEGFFFFDDAIFVVAPIIAPDKAAPEPETLRAFLVPKHTLIVMKPGVIHCPPFLAGNADELFFLVIAPQRIYTDCPILKLKPPVQISDSDKLL